MVVKRGPDNNRKSEVSCNCTWLWIWVKYLRWRRGVQRVEKQKKIKA